MNDRMCRLLAGLLVWTCSWTVVCGQRWEALQREADVVSWQVGLYVRDLSSGEEVVSYNANKLMRPASTQKVLTAVAALNVLGRDHGFATRCYCTGPVDESGVLHGDVLVVGGWDPLLSYADLKDIVGALRSLGVDSITGVVIGDVSMTEYRMLGSGWCWDDVPSDVVPYLSPLVVNHEKNIHESDGDFVSHPESYAMDVLVGEMRTAGIGLGPNVTRISLEGAPVGERRLFHEVRHTLEQVLQQMLKRSDNLYAEAVFAQLGAERAGRLASQEDCADALTAALSVMGVEKGCLNVADGCGLSLYNYVTARGLVDVLAYAHGHEAIFSVFYPALPVAGVDGTLSRRLKGTRAYRKVHAKTGTLTGVHTLAGYVERSDGHLLAFAILLNGAMDGKAARAWQDRVCVALAE